MMFYYWLISHPLDSDSLCPFPTVLVRMICVSLWTHPQFVAIGKCQLSSTHDYVSIEVRCWQMEIKMNDEFTMQSLELCRLCGIYGHVEVNILDEDRRTGPNFRAKVFRCSGIWVSSNRILSFCEIQLSNSPFPWWCRLAEMTNWRRNCASDVSKKSNASISSECFVRPPTTTSKWNSNSKVTATWPTATAKIWKMIKRLQWKSKRTIRSCKCLILFKCLRTFDF